MATGAAFVICTEPAFERKSVLLVRSIRRFAGILSTAPVYSFSPREGHAISQWAAAEFSRLGVEHSHAPLNKHYTRYGVYNKPLVCAYTERQIAAEVLIFLDSDQIIFNEPSALLIASDYTGAARPVNVVNIGVSTLQGGKDQDYWRELYSLCGVKTSSMIKTTITDCEIFAYFNSGMISTRPQNGVWGCWADTFERVMRAGLQPSDPFFIEQSVFSATISSMDKPLLLLPTSYNYPLPAHYALLDCKRIKRFEEVVSVHYHRIFENGNWRPFLTHLPFFERQSLRYDWLLENLAELNE
jgi:hypothetical protein